jgi:hypothetical protein
VSLAFAPFPERAPDALERAVWRTVTYAGMFQAPLALARLHRNLLDVAASPAEIGRALAGSWLSDRVEVVDGLVLPRGRREWIALRGTRRRHSRRLVARHRRVLRALCRFPFVRMVALSGACAHENATDHDVDVFLVTQRGRAWLVCLALTVLSRLVGVRRSLCLNYIVDEQALAFGERDLFTASEAVGMRLLAGRSTYERLLKANEWVYGAFPNFRTLAAQEAARAPEAGSRWERWLALPAPLLERLARRVLGGRLARKGRGHAGVALSPHHLKLHTQDHRPGLLASFERAVHGEGGP